MDSVEPPFFVVFHNNALDIHGPFDDSWKATEYANAKAKPNPGESCNWVIVNVKKPGKMTDKQEMYLRRSFPESKFLEENRG